MVNLVATNERTILENQFESRIEKYVTSIGLTSLLGLKISGKALREASGLYQEKDLQSLSASQQANIKSLTKKLRNTGLQSNAATVVHLVKTFLGMSILAIPYAASQAGYVLTAITMLIMTIITYFCIIKLLHAADSARLELAIAQGVSIEQVPVIGFSQVGEYVLGKWAKMVVEFCLVCYQSSVCIGYLVFVRENVTSVIIAQTNGSIHPKKNYVLALSALAMVPFCLMNSLNILTIPLFFANATLIVGLAVVLYYCSYRIFYNSIWGSSLRALSEIQNGFISNNIIHAGLFAFNKDFKNTSTINNRNLKIYKYYSPNENTNHKTFDNRNLLRNYKNDVIIDQNVSFSTKILSTPKSNKKLNNNFVDSKLNKQWYEFESNYKQNKGNYTKKIEKTIFHMVPINVKNYIIRGAQKNDYRKLNKNYSDLFSFFDRKINDSQIKMKQFNNKFIKVIKELEEKYKNSSNFSIKSSHISKNSLLTNINQSDIKQSRKLFNNLKIPLKLDNTTDISSRQIEANSNLRAESSNQIKTLDSKKETPLNSKYTKSDGKKEPILEVLINQTPDDNINNGITNDIAKSGDDKETLNNTKNTQLNSDKGILSNMYSENKKTKRYSNDKQLVIPKDKWKENNEKPDISSDKHSETNDKPIFYAFLWQGFPKLFGITVFAFEGISMMLPIRSQMAKPAYFPRLLSVTIIALSVLMVLVGTLGYFAFGEKTKELITLNLPNTTISGIIVLSYCVGLLLTFPLIVYPIYAILEGKLQNMKRRDNFNKSYFFLLRLLILTIIAVTAASIENISTLVAFVGSLMGTTLAYTLPALFHYISLKKKMTSLEKGIDIALILSGLLCTIYFSLDVIRTAHS